MVLITIPYGAIITIPYGTIITIPYGTIITIPYGTIITIPYGAIITIPLLLDSYNTIYMYYHMLNIKANSFEDVTVRVMVFKATFNNISVIL
jgi:hypothetical protein